MTERKIMQYNHTQDDVSSTIPIEEFRNSPLVKAAVSEDLAEQYASLLVARGVSEAKISTGVNHNLAKEIALYNNFHRMEKRNPSISRIRDKTNVSYDKGIVLGRDFETNQPIYKENEEFVNSRYEENGELVSRLKRALDFELGMPIGGEPIRPLWFGQLGQDYQKELEEAFPVGRFFGVVAEKR